jgi:putative flavoprotein involved in K+ transport
MSRFRNRLVGGGKNERAIVLRRRVKLPGALNEAGQPIHEDGAGTLHGLYFAGLDFASAGKSGTIPAISEETARLVDHLAKR